MEETLFLLIKGKNKKAYNYFYNLCGPALYKIIDDNLKDSASCEAVFQDVFTKISRDIDLYDPCQNKLFHWMFDIAQNEIRNINSSISSQRKS